MLSAGESTLTLAYADSFLLDSTVSMTSKWCSLPCFQGLAPFGVTSVDMGISRLLALTCTSKSLFGCAKEAA